MPSLDLTCSHSRQVSLSGVSFSLSTEDAATFLVGNSEDKVATIGYPPAYDQYRAFLDFDTSAFPLGYQITNLTLKLYLNTESTYGQTTYNSGPCSDKIHGQSNAQTAFYLYSGQVYCGASGLETPGAISISLGGTSYQDILDSITSGTFTLALFTDPDVSGDSIDVAGVGDSTPARRPILTVDYTATSDLLINIKESTTAKDTTGFGIG